MTRLHPLLKRLTFRTAVTLQLDRLLVRLRAREGAVLILNLHRVSPQPNAYWPPLHPDLFDGLLRFLTPRCRFTTFARLRDDAGAVDHRPLAILSFDDGYEDVRTYALPIMEQYGLAANINVIPKCVDSGRPPRNVELYDRLAAAPETGLEAVARLLGLSGEIDSSGGSQRVAAAVSKEMKMRAPDQVDRIWGDILSELGGFEVENPTRMMSREDLLSIGDRYEVGAHSYQHDSMEFVTDEYFREDVRRCEEFFAEEINRPLRVYAFPNGSYRESQLHVLREHGVEHMLLVGNRPSRPDTDAHERLMITGSTLPELRLQAVGYRSGWRA